MEDRVMFILHIVNNMAAGVLVEQGARASGAMVLTFFSQDIWFSTPESKLGIVEYIQILLFPFE